MTGSEKATPRPWKLDDPFGDNNLCDVCTETGLEVVSTCTSDFPNITDIANAALIVLAVNTFSEREALLREAADGLTDWCNGREIDHAGAIHLIARIRTALGETAEKGPYDG